MMYVVEYTVEGQMFDYRSNNAWELAWRLPGCVMSKLFEKQLERLNKEHGIDEPIGQTIKQFVDTVRQTFDGFPELILGDFIHRYVREAARDEILVAGREGGTDGTTYSYTPEDEDEADEED